MADYSLLTDQGYQDQQDNLRRQSESTRQAAQRRLQTQYGSRVNQGAIIKLNQDQDQQADMDLSGNLANLSMQRGQQAFQESENDKNRNIQQQQVDLAKQQFHTATDQWNSEFKENQKTNVFNKILNLSKANNGAIGDLADILGIGTNDSDFGGLVTRSRHDNYGGMSYADYIAQNR